MYIIYEDLMREYGAITFEAFINLLVGITEDQMSLDQLREAFQGVAGDKVRGLPSLIYSTQCLQRLLAVRHGAGPPFGAYPSQWNRVLTRGYALCTE